jgi:hypothetical protein
MVLIGLILFVRLFQRYFRQIKNVVYVCICTLLYSVHGTVSKVRYRYLFLYILECLGRMSYVHVHVYVIYALFNV